MIDNLLILGAIVLVALLFFKIARKTISLAFTLAGLAGILILILGFFAVQDAIEFKEQFSESRNAFVLTDGEKYYTGIEIVPDSDSINKISDLEDVAEKIENNEVPEEYYKIFVITEEALEGIKKETIDLEIAEIPKDDFIKALYSKQPTEELLADFSTQEKEMIEQSLENIFEEDIQTELFGLALEEVIGDSSLKLIYLIQNEKILIVPETILFKSLKYLPNSTFSIVERFERGE